MAHAVSVTQAATGVSTPSVAESGLPFVVGIAPLQRAEDPAAVGSPYLLTSWDEAVKKFGYSDNWATYTLCEFMYSHFKLFGCQPVVFLNLLDVSTMTTSESNQSVAVTNHKAVLSEDVVPSTVVVKDSTGTTTYVEDTDYVLYFDDENLILELLSTGSAYSAESLKCSWSKVSASGVTSAAVASAFDKVDLCVTKLGVIPDLLCAPGQSGTATVAAAMAAKAAALAGMCFAKALIDLPAGSGSTYSAAITAKGTNGFTLPEEIVCWPMAKLDTKKFHLSTLLAGRIAATDTDNDGAPYESPSNKPLPINGACLSDGTAVELSLAQANILNAAGIVTALNFMAGWVAWGNYTGGYPSGNDVKDIFIPVSRTFGWVGNTLIKTFWSRLDKPMNRRLIDSILDTCNIWLNGLVGQGVLLGGRVEMIDAENPLTSLIAGIIKLHVYITPPSPMQELDFVLEYDASYVEAALQG